MHVLLLLASRHRVALFPGVPQQHQSFSGTGGRLGGDPTQTRLQDLGQTNLLHKDLAVV